MRKAQEKELLQTAASAEGFQRLHEYILPHIKLEVEKFSEQWKISDEYKEELTKIGTTNLHRAIQMYLEHKEYETEPEGHFAAYYRWWARQAMVRFCENTALI